MEETHRELVHALLDEAAAAVPEARAVRDEHNALTYRELDELSRSFATWLWRKGLRRGDRLVVSLPSTTELVVMVYGAARCGVVLAPLNPTMQEFHLRAVLRDAEPALVITTDPATKVFASLTDAPVHALGEAWPEIAGAGHTGAPWTPPTPDDIAFLIYTSGSTAAPKAVICPHAPVVFASRAIQADLGYRPDDVVFCRFPISWDYGLYKILISCLGGGELVLASEESDLLLLKRMREAGTTVVPVVPSLAAMIVTLADRDTEPVPPVRMFTNTGAAMSDTVIKALRKQFPGVRVVRQFGQTECKRITIMPPEQDLQRPDSVGRPLRGTTVHIVDGDGDPVPTGETGEIVAAGPHVMRGYWRQPELSARTFRRHPETGQPRLHTGDYGHLDADGYLYFDGRRDDMFKRRGIRMSTVEIEAAALDIHGVRVACALPPVGERDLAIFAEAELEPHTLLQELNRRLEPAKVPSICRVVAELPLTRHGKHDRQAMAELLDGRKS